MANWGFWEWVAYAALFVAAGLIAFDEVIRMVPHLRHPYGEILENRFWGFVPLLLVFLATGILVSREMGLIGRQSELSSMPKVQTVHSP